MPTLRKVRRTLLLTRVLVAVCAAAAATARGPWPPRWLVAAGYERIDAFDEFAF